MSVISGVITIALIALLESSIVLAAAIIGVMLRLSQENVMETRLFWFVRMYGLRGTARGICHIIAVGRIDILLARRYWRSWRQLAFSVAMIPFTAGIAAAIAGFLPSFLPAVYTSLKLAGLFTWIAVMSGVLGAAAGGYVWLSGLSYAARAAVQGRGSLPRVSIPGLSRAARDELALGIYWRSRISWAIGAGASYPSVILVLTSLSAAIAGIPAAAGSTQAPATEGLLVLAGFSALTYIPPIVTSRSIERRMVLARLAAQLCILLEPRTWDGQFSQHFSSGMITDPLGRRRPVLARTVNYLSRVAWEVDAGQARGTAPHPLATLLRAVSSEIRQFLRSNRSLDRKLPADLRELIEAMVIVLADPQDPGSFERLAKLVPAAFDQDGNPAIELEAKQPGRLITAVHHATEGIKGFVALLVALLTIVAFAIVWTLFALHRMNISDVLHYMP